MSKRVILLVVRTQAVHAGFLYDSCSRESIFTIALVAFLLEENFSGASRRNQLEDEFSKGSARRNFYNSTVEEESIEEEVDITAEVRRAHQKCSSIVFLLCYGVKNAFVYFALQEEMIERITCSCKGQCALKGGRGACICRKEDLKCLAMCKCDKSKCKSKVNI